MSSAITELHLELPPVEVRKVGTVHAPLWQARCECGHTTKRCNLLSMALREMHWHQEMHRTWTAELRAEGLAA